MHERNGRVHPSSPPMRASNPSGNETPCPPVMSAQIDTAPCTVGARNITIAKVTDRNVKIQAGIARSLSRFLRTGPNHEAGSGATRG